MALQATEIMTAMRARLTADATLSAAIQGVWVSSAPHQTVLTPASLPYVVISPVLGEQLDSFEADHARFVVDVSVFAHRDTDPAGAISARGMAVDLLHRWSPTLPGNAATELSRTLSTDAHNDDAWQFVDSYQVWVTEV